MNKQNVQANFQLVDSYISKYSLEIFEKIYDKEEIKLEYNIGFGIIDINEEKSVGQVELAYDIDIVCKNKKVAKIILEMNALFSGEKIEDRKAFENMLKINGATTLSHLSRAYITSVTAMSGMPTITMPLINFNKFFENKDN